MKINLKCPLLLTRGDRNLLFLILIMGILFGISLPGTLKAPRSASLSEARLEEAAQAEADLAEISDQKDSGELAIIEGNSLLPISDSTNPEPQQVRRIRVVVTGYSSTEDQTDGDPYLTAAGTWVKDGIVANNYLAMGTKIRIPEIFGDKVFVVEDRMSWKKGNYHIDIWFPSYWEALNFGAKRTYIEILES